MTSVKNDWRVPSASIPDGSGERVDPAPDVTFLTYQADHGFSGVRPEMADDIREWLGQQLRH